MMACPDLCKFRRTAREYYITTIVDGVYEYTGKLVHIPDDIQQEVIADMENDSPEFKDLFLPMMLDASDFKLSGYIGIGISAIVFVLCAVGVIRVLLRSGNSTRHPIMRDLARFGDPEDVRPD